MAEELALLSVHTGPHITIIINKGLTQGTV